MTSTSKDWADKAEVRRRCEEIRKITLTLFAARVASGSTLTSEKLMKIAKRDAEIFVCEMDCYEDIEIARFEEDSA